MRVALAALLFLSACASEPVQDSSTIALPTSTVVVDYEGTLEDGTVFDQGDDIEFPLDAVILGFKNGIGGLNPGEGMHVGETKTLVVPPEEGYGSMGAPPDIPPNATLTFVVTLKRVK